MTSMAIDWKYNIGVKGGQKTKVSKKAVVTEDQNPAREMRVTLSRKGSDLEGAIEAICNDIKNIEKVTLIIPGKKEELTKQAQKIAEIVAEYGNQDTLDVYQKEKIPA